MTSVPTAYRSVMHKPYLQRRGLSASAEGACSLVPRPASSALLTFELARNQKSGSSLASAELKPVQGEVLGTSKFMVRACVWQLFIRSSWAPRAGAHKLLSLSFVE